MILFVAGAGLTAMNRCAFNVWPVFQSTNNGVVVDTVYAAAVGLKPNGSIAVSVSDDWNGRIWGRIGCVYNGDGSIKRCETGSGGSNVTVAEISFVAANNITFYDVSILSGFNLPLSLSPSPPLGCSEASCLADINRLNNSGNTTLEKLCPNSFVPGGPDRTFACNQSEFTVTFCSNYSFVGPISVNVNESIANVSITPGPSPGSPVTISPTQRVSPGSPVTISPTQRVSPGPTSLPLIVGVCSGVIGIVGFVVGCLVWTGRSRRKHEKSKIPGIGPRKFKYKELYSATKGFSPSELLGEGGHGQVYKGILMGSGLPVAVKKVPAGKGGRGMQELVSEMKIISTLRHRNLLQFQGWCENKGELLVVYDYMPKGSLDKALFAHDDFVLDWHTRYKIVCGLGQALLYLHDEGEKRVVHRDVKPSNIMLDANFEAKLGDFGLARLIDHGVTPRTTAVAGTIGYVAPELTRTRRPTAESDVFSFGIVALEVACGRQSFLLASESGSFLLLDKVRNLAKQGRLMEVADPRLAGSFDVDEIERLLSVGLAAAKTDPDERPTMKQIITILTREAPASLNIEEE